MTAVDTEPAPEPAAPEPEGYYLTADVLAATGVTFRRLDYWTRTGIVGLTGDAATPGSGSPRRWRPRDVDVIRHMASLTDAGFTVVAAARMAKDAVDHDLFTHTYPDGTEVSWTPIPR